MKLSLFVAVVAVVLSTTSSAAEPRSYPLVCRGGPDMSAHFNRVDLPVAGTTAQVTFRWARVGASVRAPAPGECAWLDRGGRPDEPTRLRMIAATNITVHFNGSGQITRLLDDRAPLVNTLQQLLAGRQFHLHAFAAGGARGLLEVTRIGR